MASSPGRTPPTPAAGPLDAALARVGDRWALLVVDALLGGPRRYGDLATALPGVATNVLSGRLRRLEAEGVVVAEPYQQRPVRHAYRLTSTGAELAGALRLLAHWGGSAAGPTHDACGTALEVRWWCPTCDRPVGDGAEEPVTWV